MINYHNRRFAVHSNSANGALDGDTKFVYKQEDGIVTCTYFGNSIIVGNLIAVVGAQGELDMRYHQVNRNGELMTGTCISRPELLPNGKIRLHEKWKWTSGDYSEGYSILEEE